MTNASTDNAASLLEAHKNSVSSWWRTQSATMNILKHVYSLVEASEKKIAEQERIIRQLEGLASTDALTGLLNRRGLEEFFEREMARIHRNKSMGGLLVLIDLDHFKRTNDNFGHAAGDACLKLVGETLKNSIRQIDAAARFGGDEFALILTETDVGRAMRKIETLRQALNRLVLDWESWSIPIGASLGVAPFTDATGFEKAYRIADAALYGDKTTRHAQLGSAVSH